MPKIPVREMLKSIPETLGIRVNEEPPYQVLTTEDGVEIRSYQSQLWAHVSKGGLSFEEFQNKAFKKLASYIFEKNSERKATAMTAPVLQDDKHDSWTMSFILESKYNMATVPKPMESGVVLEEVPAFTAAVLRYSGNNSLAKIRSHQRKLEDWLKAHPQYRQLGSIFVAQYDGPFVLPFMKTNEVMAKVATKSGKIH